MAVFVTRYAGALADVVSSSHLDTTAIDSQLSDFAAAWKESPDLREVFLNPAFPVEERIAILDKLNQKLQMSPPVRNFIAILITNDRIAAFEEVLTEYRKEINSRLGIAEAEITTVRTLDPAERENLESEVAKLAGARVKAHFREDASILGGAIVRIGTTIYDGSIRGRLDRLKQVLLAG